MRPGGRRVDPRALAAAALWLGAALVLATGIGPLSPHEAVGGLSALVDGVLAGRDTLTHDYPAAWWGWSQMRQTGLLPLWNPSWFGGEPFVASQTFLPFYPPNWLGAVLPFPLAFNIQYPLHLLLAAAVMAWACRRRGLSWTAAALAGLAWGLGGPLATLAGPGHIQKLQTLVWLPLVALGAARLARGHGRRALLPLGIGLGLQVTAGNLQIVYLTLVVAFFEGLVGAWGLRRTRRINQTRPTGPTGLARRAWRVAAGAGAAALLALGLSAALWVPTAEFARLSNREGTLDWENATRGSLPPEEWDEFALPRALGDSMPGGRGVYLGRYGESSTSAPERTISDYVGAGVLVFALYGLLVGGGGTERRRRRGRRAAWRYALLAAGALVLSMARYLMVGKVQIYMFALRFIPGLAHFRAPSVAMALLGYGLVMAAAIGLDRFFRLTRFSHAPEGAAADAAAGRDRAERAWRMRGSVMLLLFVVALAPALWSRDALAVVARSAAAAGDPAAQRARQAFVLRMEAVREASDDLLVVLALAGLWAWAASLPAGLRGRRWALRGLLAALAAGWGWGLTRNARPFWNAAALAPYEEFLTTHWALPLWQRAPQPVRYLEPGNELSNRALTLSDFASGRLVASAHGYHPVAYEQYFDLLRRLGFENETFLRLYAVDYLLWDAGRQDAPPPGFSEVARWTPPPPTPQQRLLYNPQNVYARPMGQPVRVENWKEALDRIAQPGWLARGETLVLGDPPPGAPPYADAAAAGLRIARVVPLAPGQTEIRVAARAPAWLVVSEPAIPGWRTRVNGKAIGHITADGFFVGIPVPAGESTVDLAYDPVSQRLGIYISLLALAWMAWRLGRTVSIAPKA